MKGHKPTVQRRRETLRLTSKPSSDIEKSLPVWIWVGLVVLAVFPYLQTFRHDFINFDDGGYVAANPIVHQGLTWSNLRWAFTTMAVAYWHPLTWMSHMLDCQLFGVRPGWHHLTNVAFHAANTVLVFVILRVMTGMLWRSALVAALFAIHPLHVESVAWIAERKDVLSTFFGLLAIRAYVKYARSPSLSRYGLVAGLFICSLLSKPMWVTFPCILLLLDVWPLKRVSIDNSKQNQRSKITSLLLEKLPLLLISGASSVVTFKAQHILGTVATIEGLSLGQRAMNAIVSYAAYLYKAVWPVHLAAIYPLRHETSLLEFAAAATIVGGITIGAIMLSRSRPWLVVGWLWFLGTLVPVIGLVQVGDQAMADRYTYMSLIGVFIMIVWSLPERAFVSPALTRVTAVSATVIMAVLAIVTFTYARAWKNSKTLFEHALEVTDNNFTAHNILAGALGDEGDLAGARRHAEEALKLRPDYGGAHYNLGLIMLRERDFGHAQEQFNLALQTNREDAMIWNGLGLANQNLGRGEEAISNYRHATQLDPYFADAFMDLGAALLAQGNYAEAAEMCGKALQLRPGIAQTHVTLGAALLSLGRTDESIPVNRTAIALNPNLTLPRINLAMALLSKRNPDEAIAQLEYVVRLIPQDEVAQNLLATARQERDAMSARP